MITRKNIEGLAPDAKLYCQAQHLRDIGHAVDESVPAKRYVDVLVRDLEVTIARNEAEAEARESEDFELGPGAVIDPPHEDDDTRPMPPE